MDVRDAVASRYSCRAFLSATSLNLSSAISLNAQLVDTDWWQSPALARARLDRSACLNTSRRLFVLAPSYCHEEKEQNTTSIRPKLAEPYETRRRQVGAALYQSIGVTRDDRRGRYRQYARNFEFYNAPVALLIFLDRSMGPPQWSDVGGYIQTIMLLAREHGLHTCGLEAWTHWHKTVYSALNIPTSLMLFCGMALGYEDPTAPINQWRAPREPFSNYATLSGFDDGNPSMQR